MPINSREYHQYRSRKERELAATAVDSKIAAIHIEMAERYELLAAGASTNDKSGRAPNSD